MAIWPTFTLPISDSLKGTTSCIEERSLSTANAELDEPVEPEPDEPEDPEEDAAAPERAEEEALLAPDALDPDEPEEPPALEARVVPLADTTSPSSPESETIVPLSGA